MDSKMILAIVLFSNLSGIAMMYFYDKMCAEKISKLETIINILERDNHDLRTKLFMKGDNNGN